MSAIGALLRAIVLGVLLGALTSVADAAVGTSWGQESTAIRAATVVLNFGALWALVAFLLGRKARGQVAAMLAGVSALGAAVLAYYAYGATFGNRTDTPYDTLTDAATTWLVIAVFAGPLLGWAGRRSRIRDPLGTAMLATVPVIVFAEVAYRFWPIGPVLRGEQVLGGAVTALLGLAWVALVVLLLLSVGRWRRYESRERALQAQEQAALAANPQRAHGPGPTAVPSFRGVRTRA